jgi:hypothetical protein
MPHVYSIGVINSRLQQTVDAMDAAALGFRIRDLHLMSRAEA